MVWNNHLVEALRGVNDIPPANSHSDPESLLKIHGRHTVTFLDLSFRSFRRKVMHMEVILGTCNQI